MGTPVETTWQNSLQKCFAYIVKYEDAQSTRRESARMIRRGKSYTQSDGGEDIEDVEEDWFNWWSLLSFESGIQRSRPDFCRKIHSCPLAILTPNLIVWVLLDRFTDELLVFIVPSLGVPSCKT